MRTTEKSENTQSTNPATWTGRIDVAPALDALDDLARWAFGLAEQWIGDSIEDRRRIRNARRYVSKRIHGEEARCPTDDLAHTARLLARVCEAELGLPPGFVVSMLDNLELPADDVPRVARPSTAWHGPVTRLPTMPPRTEEEEEAHWFKLCFGHDDVEPIGDDQVDDEHEPDPAPANLVALADRFAEFMTRQKAARASAPCASCGVARKAA